MKKYLVVGLACLTAIGLMSEPAFAKAKSTKHHKPAVRKVLRGPAGPQGPQGSQGPAGPQGPAGSPASIKVQYVQNTGAYGPYSSGASSVQSVTASCPAGSVVVGGAANASTISAHISTFAGPTSYAAVVNNESSYYGTLYVRDLRERTDGGLRAIPGGGLRPATTVSRQDRTAR
jgi:hypothetical protein